MHSLPVNLRPAYFNEKGSKTLIDMENAKEPEYSNELFDNAI